MEKQWYIARDKNVSGPFAESEVRQFAEAGRLIATDLIWKAGMADWRPAGESSTLFPGASISNETSAEIAAPLEAQSVRTMCLACYNDVAVDVPAGEDIATCPECGALIQIDPSLLQNGQSSAKPFEGLEVELTERIRQRMQQAYEREAGETSIAKRLLGGGIGGLFG